MKMKLPTAAWTRFFAARAAMPRRIAVKAIRRAGGPLLAALLIAVFNASVATVFGQGSLTPPGAPAPTMKTLAQIEPRTPIASAPFTITEPGSYYVTSNLTVNAGDAITIATNDVKLDLNGFTISSTGPSPSGSGIHINLRLSDITIVNGHIRGGVTNNGSGVYGGTGFENGISYSSVDPVNVMVSRVSVSGCLYDGINLSLTAATVVNCTVRTVGNRGILASTINGCSVIDCGSEGIHGEQVSNCHGEGSNGSGIYAFTIALNCYGHSGIAAGVNASTAIGCYGESDAGTGLIAYIANASYGNSELVTHKYNMP